MGILGTLLKTTIHAATLPVDLVKDVFAEGGQLDWTRPEQPSFTERKLKTLKKDVDDIKDDVCEL